MFHHVLSDSVMFHHVLSHSITFYPVLLASIGFHPLIWYLVACYDLTVGLFSGLVNLFGVSEPCVSLGVRMLWWIVKFLGWDGFSYQTRPDWSICFEVNNDRTISMCDSMAALMCDSFLLPFSFMPTMDMSLLVLVPRYPTPSLCYNYDIPCKTSTKDTSECYTQLDRAWLDHALSAWLQRCTTTLTIFHPTMSSQHVVCRMFTKKLSDCITYITGKGSFQFFGQFMSQLLSHEDSHAKSQVIIQTVQNFLEKDNLRTFLDSVKNTQCWKAGVTFRMWYLSMHFTQKVPNKGVCLLH